MTQAVDLTVWVNHFKEQAEKQKASTEVNAKKVDADTGSIGDAIVKIGVSGEPITAHKLQLSGKSEEHKVASGSVQQSVEQAVNEIRREREEEADKIGVKKARGRRRVRTQFLRSQQWMDSITFISLGKERVLGEKS